MQYATWFSRTVDDGYARELQDYVRATRLARRWQHFMQCVAGTDGGVIVVIPRPARLFEYEAPRNERDTRPTLQDALTDAPITKNEIAALAGISVDYLRQLARCKFAANAPLQRRLAAVLGLAVAGIRWPILVIDSDNDAERSA